ncbi:MAG TPA: hypothetical protein VG456_08510, partial [Candidatus Sulfopaludibacter sp.]|nr:hypothetical protein [Candidatus Sulfopaludibacter sp.]
CYALAASLAVLAYGAKPTTPAKKAPAKKTVAKKTTKKAAPRTTWRNRQTVPSPERYKEIQDALVAKGYLRTEDTASGWNQSSMDALKRFQTDQKIDNSGKINSLSLIALGLGPKHDANPTKAPDAVSQQDR